MCPEVELSWTVQAEAVDWKLVPPQIFVQMRMLVCTELCVYCEMYSTLQIIIDTFLERVPNHVMIFIMAVIMKVL